MRTASQTLPGQPAVGTVPPFRVVEHLDVLENIRTRLVVIAVDPPLDPLEEALHRCVVGAIASSTQAAHDFVLAQEALPVFTGELRALV